MQNRIYKKYGKRCFDFTMAIVGTIILSPLFFIIALAVWLNDRGPVFYVQNRMGINFQPFKLFKFRTMQEGADGQGPLLTQRKDSRITSIGKFLRKFKLDELPQIFNVIKGELSFVGPRPEVEQYVKLFAADYSTILKVRPGITDYAAIEFKDEEELLLQFDDIHQGYIKYVLPEKIKLYKQYIQDQSFFTDFNIILKTFWKILK